MLTALENIFEHTVANVTVGDGLKRLILNVFMMIGKSDKRKLGNASYATKACSIICTNVQSVAEP